MRKIIFIISVFFTAHLSLFAQGISVSGTVTDETNEPMVGVSVVVKGTSIGTVSDLDGTYRITVPNAESVLEFYYLSYARQEIAVRSQRVINVSMKPDDMLLDEVVVIGYGTATKQSLTSSISSIQTDELLKSPTTSLSNAIAGRLPGFSAIQYSGLPGFDDPNIFVRGVGTLSSGNSTPLILVDGVERPFTQLDPNEVADISILKDAGSTAVFGVRGANGVILVTTKRGESGKARVSASASYGIQAPVQIVKFADSYLYANTYNEAQRRDGVPKEQWMFSDEAIRHFQLGDQPVLYPSIDWMTYILKDYAPQNTVNVSVNGGNDRTKYFVSVSSLFQDGLFKTFAADPRENFRYHRYNYRANLDVKLTKTTDLNLNLGGRIEDRTSTNDPNSENSREGFIYRYIMEAPPMASAGIVDGKHVQTNGSLIPMYIVRDGLWSYYARGFRQSVTNVLNFDLTLNQKLDFITQGLNAELKGSYNNTFVLNKDRPTHLTGMMGVSSYYPIPERDAEGNITGYHLEKTSDSQVLGYNESYSYNRNWYFDVKLNYARKFAKDHNVSALLLYNQSKNYYPGGSWDDVPRGYIGLVSRVAYNYKNKYLLDLNMGYNGSENFAPGKRYGFFPSTSAGWVITEENFMKSQQVFDFLKLRYSWGIVGSHQGVGRFLYNPATFSFASPRGAGSGSGAAPGGIYYFGERTAQSGKPTIREDNLGNPDVTWEKARKQNIGMDLRSVKNRLGVTFDYFWEHRWDILVGSGARIPVHFALPNSPAINYGIVDNWGYEIELKWSDQIGKDFRYTIAPNMSFTRNKRVEMLETPPAEPYLARTGTKVDQPFAREFFGFYYEGIEAEYLAYVTSLPGYTTYYVNNDANKDANGNLIPYGFPDHLVTLKPGDAVYVDLNYDGRIDNNDQHAIGFPDYPEFYFGLNMSFKYKRFDLSMLWVGATNTDRNLGRYHPPFGSQNNGALIKYVAENSWTEENLNPEFPRITFLNRSNNDAFSRLYLQDASYARLKNLELSYDFNVARVPYVSNFKLFFTGYNLLTFTGYKANDPETSGDSFRYPPTKVYNVGFRVNF